MKDAVEDMLRIHHLATGGSAMGAFRKQLALEALICGPTKAARLSLGAVDKGSMTPVKKLEVSLADSMTRKEESLNAMLWSFKNAAANVDLLKLGLEKPGPFDGKEDHDPCPRCGK